MGSRRRCKLAYSTATALLLLLSLESYTTHATSPAAVDNQILRNNARDMFERNLAGSKSAKPEHKPHHGGGGKHDSGVDGHHVKNNGGKADKPAPAAAVASSPSRGDADGSSKSGKATPATMVLAVSSDVATADEPVYEHETAGEHMALEIEEEVISAQQHHTSKAAKDMKEEEYVMTTDDSDSGSDIAESKAGKEEYITSDSSAGAKAGKDEDSYSTSSSGGTASGKSGKAASTSSPAMSYPEAASGKSGKATTSSGSSGGGGSYSGKSGKATTSSTTIMKGDAHMSYQTKSDKDPEAKVTKEAPTDDHAEVKGGSTKPKAEKQLTEWFIKEPTHGNDAEASGGKSGKSTGDITVASGKADKGGDDGGYSGKSGKAHTMSYDDSVVGGAKAAKAVMSYDHSTTTPEPAPTDTDGDAATMVPAPTPDIDEPTTPVLPDTPAPVEPAPAPVDTPSVEEPTVPTMPTDLLTMEPTPSPSTEPPVSDGTDNLPEPPTDDPNAKWFPTENDEGRRYCEYGTTELPAQFQFETKDDCCEAFPEACPPTLPPSDGVQKAPPSPTDNEERDAYEDEESTYPTYFPTGPPTSFKEPLLSTLGGEDTTNTVAMEPFALKYFADVDEPNWDEEVVKRVTMEHIVHSFRNCINLHDASVCTQDWQLDSLDLRVLEQARHLKHGSSSAISNSPLALRYLSQHPVFELIYGGILHFPDGNPTPSVEEMGHVVAASFSHERLEYYVQLLKEAGIDVKHARLVEGHELENGISNERGAEGDSEGFNWAGLLIGMSSAFGGVALLSVGSRYYYQRRQAQIDNLDLDVEKGGDYAIRLQYTNDEIEAYGASTIAETATQDQLSVPSLVRGGEDETGTLLTPGGTNSYSSSKKSQDSASISPLESPQGLKSVPEEGASTRYISVFTVKKDCGGKPLDQVDLRALAIAYLSRMLRKFPNTHLLPYDKKSTLPSITNIRNIPDDLEELQQYVGNARLDDRTGKVLFNLRVESDEPVSKMKSGSGSSRGMNKLKVKAHTASPKIADPPKSKSPSNDVGDGVVEEDGNALKSPKSPKSPGIMEDVEL